MDKETRRDDVVRGPDPQATGEEGGSGAPQPRRARRRWSIVVAVVAVVVLVAGGGFWVWHEQPSFCNAICHVPMDPYVEGYYEDDALMAHAHQVEGTTCLQCHEPKMEEQVHEALVWVSGDYDVDEDGMLTRVGVRSDSAMCAVSGCHDFDDVVAATADWGGEEGVNPHDSHQGRAIDCSNCHSAHGQSVMYCNTCHDYEVPEGWAEPARSADASVAA
ncbi:MAG: cytochrome c3 family protein [Eggerthellaceae bacterium]|nr:cytochrome c3 family protein [Eggerthellaceae bacterium]